MNDIYQPPQSELSETTPEGEFGSIERGIAGDYNLEIGAVLSEAWQRTSGAKWTIHLAFGLYFLLYLAFILIFASIFTAAGLRTVPEELQGLPPAVLLLVNSNPIESILQGILTMPLWAGLMMLGVRRAAGAPISAVEIMGYYNKIVALTLAYVLITIMVMIGFILLILPGIYLMIAYSMTLPLIIDKGLSPWQAMEASRKAVTKRWFTVFGLYIVIMLINMVAFIPLGIGMIWSVPLFLIASGVIYRNMFGCEPATLKG